MAQPKNSSSFHQYGSKGQTWSPEFIAYMKFIVAHPNYSGMPDAIDDEGKIQWEAPSNRSGGKYQHTHQKRREWWTKKAIEIGINPQSDKWISRTAKTIHPTGEKPCKRCGKTYKLAYVYPGLLLITKLRKSFGRDLQINADDTIYTIVGNIIKGNGNDAINTLGELLQTKTLKTPSFKDAKSLLKWIEEEYVPKEPVYLSPGAMSNAPDRFDGYHSFNRCCRGSADSGRQAENLKSYVTDRRVFEFWSEGDWVAADRLMGLIRSRFSEETNFDGGDGPPSADHIGPISLGFCHSPHFRLLSKSANSAKNNRMSLLDVKDLLEFEAKGNQVASWFAENLWNARKQDIDTEEKALRFSKMLRDNLRNAMALLSMLAERKQYVFLLYLLELDRANFNIEFDQLCIDDYKTKYHQIIKKERTTKYAVEQKSRRVRIAFESLKQYKEKENRHSQLVDEQSLQKVADEVQLFLQKNANETIRVNEDLDAILNPKNELPSEEKVREFLTKFTFTNLQPLKMAKQMLVKEMFKVSTAISKMWNDDRYVRDILPREGI